MCVKGGMCGGRSECKGWRESVRGEDGKCVRGGRVFEGCV